MNEEKEAWENEIKETQDKQALLDKTLRCESRLRLFLFVSAVAPIVLYHLDIMNIYCLMASDAVAAYTTAIYVSAMLAFKLVNDVRRDRSEFKMTVYRSNRSGIDASAGRHAGFKLKQTERELLTVNIYDSKTRMVRYLAVWVSYVFVSLSYASVRSAVGG